MFARRLKGNTNTELLDAVRAVYAGQKRVSSEAAELAEHAGEEALSERELEVLRLVGGKRQ